MFFDARKEKARTKDSSANNEQPFDQSESISEEKILKLIYCPLSIIISMIMALFRIEKKTERKRKERKWPLLFSDRLFFMHIFTEISRAHPQ